MPHAVLGGFKGVRRRGFHILIGLGVAALGVCFLIDLLLPPHRYEDVTYSVADARRFDDFDGTAADGTRICAIMPWFHGLDPHSGHAGEVRVARNPLGIGEVTSIVPDGDGRERWDAGVLTWVMRMMADLVAVALTTFFLDWWFTGGKLGKRVWAYFEPKLMAVHRARAGLPPLAPRTEVASNDVPGCHPLRKGTGANAAVADDPWSSPAPWAFEHLASRRIRWRETGNAYVPWECDWGGSRFRLRLNEFPEEPYLYSLIRDDAVVHHFQTEDWPGGWERPDDATPERDWTDDRFGVPSPIVLTIGRAPFEDIKAVEQIPVLELDTRLVQKTRMIIRGGRDPIALLGFLHEWSDAFTFVERPREEVVPSHGLTGLGGTTVVEPFQVREFHRDLTDMRGRQGDQLVIGLGREAKDVDQAVDFDEIREALHGGHWPDEPNSALEAAAVTRALLDIATHASLAGHAVVWRFDLPSPQVVPED